MDEFDTDFQVSTGDIPPFKLDDGCFAAHISLGSMTPNFGKHNQLQTPDDSETSNVSCHNI